MFSLVWDGNSLKYYPFPGARSVQVAEIVAVTTACQLGRDKRGTIYTDSKYAFGIAHDFGVLWEQCGLTASGISFKHGSHIKFLLDALFFQRN